MLNVGKSAFSCTADRKGHQYTSMEKNLAKSQVHISFHLATSLTLGILFIFIFSSAKCMHLKVMIAAQFLIKKDWKHLKYPYIGDDWFNQKNTKSHRHKEQ